MKEKKKSQAQHSGPTENEQNVLLKTFIHDAPHPYMVLEESGMVASINPALARLLQGSEKDYAHTALVNMVVPASRRGYFDSFRQFINGSEGETLDILLRRENGMSLPVSLHRHRELDTKEGVRQYIVAVCESIIEERIAERVATLTDQIERRAEDQIRLLENKLVERERIERAFRESQERQTLAFWGADMAWGEYNIKTDILRFSPRINQMLGDAYSVDSMKSSDFYNLIHKDDQSNAEKAFHEHLEGNVSIVNVRVRMVSHSCAWKWISLRGRVTEFDKNSKPIRMIGVIQDINETKQSEEEHALFFKHASDMFVILGQDGTLLQVNPAWERILGWKISEMQGQPAISFTHPLDQENGLEVLQKMCNNETPPLFEQRVLCKDGSFRWLSCLLVTLPEYGVSIGIGRDITEQKEQENKIREQKQNLEQLVSRRSAELQQQKAYLDEAMSIGQIAHWEYDLDTGEFIFNEAIYQILRTNAKREGGYRIKASVFQERFLPAPNMKTLATCMADISNADLQSLRSFEAPIRYKDGSPGYAMVRIRVEKDANDKITRVFGIAQDISSQKGMKAELENREHMYRMLFETSPSPVFVAEANSGMLIDANERALEFSGLTIEDIKGFHFTRLHDESSQKAVKCTFDSISKYKKMESVIAKLRHHSGDYRPVIIHTKAVACGEKVYAVAIMTDIEEQKAMIKEASNDLNVSATD